MRRLALVAATAAIAGVALLAGSELLRRAGGRGLWQRSVRGSEPMTHEGDLRRDYARPLTPELRVEGEGHPNAAMRFLRAECVAQRLRPLP